MTIKHCRLCGKPYRPIKGNQVICPVCKQRNRGKRVMHTVTCPVCGELFTTDLYNKEYCSKECREFANRGEEPMLEKICPQCKEEFKATKVSRVYCSKECARKAKAILDAAWRKKKQGGEPC